MARRLTVQFDLHSRWCSINEVGDVGGGREKRRAAAGKVFWWAARVSNWRCVLRSLCADVECERAKGGCCVVVRVTFLEARFSISRHSINRRGRIAHWESKHP